MLTDTGGLVVTDDGRRVLVIDRGTGPLAVLAFVLGVLALIAGGFGAVALITGTPSWRRQRSSWCARSAATAADRCTNAGPWR